IYTALVFCLLANFCVARQSSASSDNVATSPSLIWNNANSHSSTPPPLKLDPVLRRALLRALTQLELEAQRKAVGETVPPPEQTPTDNQSVDEVQESNIKRDLEDLLGNYENSFKQNFEYTKIQDDLPEQPETPEENHQEQHHETSNESIDMIVMDGPVQEQADVSVFDYELPVDGKSNSETESQQPDESSTFVEKPEEAAIFYRNENVPEIKLEDISQNQPESQSIDIQSNIIHSNSQDVNEKSFKKGDEVDSKQLTTSTLSSSDKKTTDVNNNNNIPTFDNKSSATSTSGSVKLDLDDHDVSIFQAPLVAAFTLEQDEKGNPKSVVPLIRRPHPVINQQQQRLQQQHSSLGFNQQQAQFTSFQVPAQQHRFQPIQPQLTREQELERKTRLLQEQLLQLQQQQQRQQQFQQQELLKQQQQTLQQEQIRLRQQKLFEEEQQRLRFSSQLIIFEQPPPPPPLSLPLQHQRPLRQETGTAVAGFQQNSDFQFHFQQPSSGFQQQSSNSFQQPSNSFSDRPFIPLSQQTSFQNSSPSNVNSQLQNLLYQSGVAGDFAGFASPQEDLNIVSKVLSLNHEGRIRPGRETLELT
ncbi:hypothetical protein L9F63_020528, partial [Diploptera punctata]